MNKIKLMINACAIVPIAFVPLTTIVSCSSDLNPKIKDHEQKESYFYNVVNNEQGKEPGLHYELAVKDPCVVHFFNESSVGYLNVDDYVKNEMQYSNIKGHNYSSNTSDYMTRITNLYNNAYCIIDYKKQQLIFSDYDAFLNTDLDMDNPLASGIGGGEGLFNRVISQYVAPTKSYVIDLNKYNIKAYYDDNKGYLPYEIFRNLINNSSDAGKYMFNGVNFYEMTGKDNGLSVYDLPKENATIFTSEYMEYRYNLLAITLDNRFGMTTRQSRAHKGNTITYMPNGAYEALKPYHDKLVSLDPNVSNLALRLFMNNNLDDGGHARYENYDLLSDTKLETKFGDEYELTKASKSAMQAARDKHAGGKWNWDDPKGTGDATQKIELLDLDKNGSKETAWVTFDSFKYTEIEDFRQLESWKPYYQNVDKDTKDGHIPYQYDTILMTMYLQKLVNAENSEIKNVFIDLNCNGGGTVCTEHFLASYLCGSNGVKRALWNPHTGAYGEYTMFADVNCDGVYNEQDYLPSDVNLYVITSENSFSCGNMLPTDLKACSKAKFIGANCGGGACYVDSNMHLGLGAYFRSSSNFHSLMSNSTIDNKISNDSGVEPKYKLDWHSNIDDFFDREEIWKLVHQE